MPNTEADEGRWEAMRAYPDTADLTDYDPLAEAEFEAARKAAEANPHDWPREASERVIAALTAACCRDCDGSGEVPTGRHIPADMFGPREPILTRCLTCDGTGYPESETS